MQKKYACGTQTAYSDKNEHVYSAAKFLELGEAYPKLNEALLKITPLIKCHQEEIESLIDALPTAIEDRKGHVYEVCGSHIKKLFKLQLNARLENLLMPQKQKALEKSKFCEDWVR